MLAASELETLALLREELPMPVDSLRQTKARIESLLADSKLAGDEKLRESLYRRILRPLMGTKRPGETSPEGALESVLQAMARAIEKRQQAPEKQKTEGRRATYWKERKSLEEAIDAVACHPLIASFPREEIAFKSLEAAYCRHGRFRETCAWIRRQLECLKSDPSDESARRFLQAIGVPPKSHPQDYCAYTVEPMTPEAYRAEITPPPRPRRRGRGRPSDAILDEYFAAATAALQHGGLSKGSAFDFATELVAACLGEEPSAEYRVRQARRSRPSARTKIPKS